MLTKSHRRGSCALLGTILITTMPLYAQNAPILVDADATGTPDGDTWSTAWPTLQQGLADASQNQGVVEVWVAQGTYIPGTLATDSFELQLGVSIYGGFIGTESVLSQRNANPETNGTILSGDLPGSVFAYHVVTATNIDEGDIKFIHLDGVRVVSGNANGSNEDASGGGILCIAGGNVRINNCIIEDNHADEIGGGAAAIDSFPAFTVCTFRDNDAGTTTVLRGFGGGLGVDNANEASDACLVYNCTFTDNTATGQGGGGIAVLDEDTGSQQTALSRATIVNSLIYRNTAVRYVDPRTGAAPSSGGGVLAFFDGVVDIVNCTIVNNLDNDTTPNNVAYDLTTNAISAATPLIDNSILWFDPNLGLGTNARFLNGSAPAVEIHSTYGINCDGSPPYGACINEIDDDPQFVDPANDNYRLFCNSPGFNRGSNTLVADDVFNLDGDTETNDDNPDLELAERVQDGHVDIGVYEEGEPHSCPADTNFDGVVDVTDLLTLLADWGPCNYPTSSCQGDITTLGTEPCGRDGVVNVSDLLLLLAEWGDCADPTGDYTDLHEAAGISEQEYADYLDVMANGTQQEKDRWHCWYTERIFWASTPPPWEEPDCPGADPFAGS